jgi:hypothetical protein
VSIATEVLVETFKRTGGAIGIGARALGFGRKAIKAVTGVFRGSTKARPGIGSPITKGPLKVGGKVIYGAKPGMTTAAKVAAAVGAGGVGLVTVASHRVGGVQMSPSTKPRGRAASATQSQPSPRRSSPKATSTKGKKCCPAGTKRMVCFKKDVDEVAETKRKAKARQKKARAIKRGRKSARKQSAKQKAARARFAKAARKGRIRKGTRL